jgi:hypothetical protein
MHRKLFTLVSSWALALSLTSCDDDGGSSAPANAICLYELGSCSEGEYGTGCPPGESDYTTQCIDTTTNYCVQAGQDSEWDYDLNTTFYTYTVNPRLVQGVTCADWSSMPGIDPDPPTATCAYENDGVCDVPGVCPEGTDLADCQTPTCAYENDGVCDVPDYCPEGTDLADCDTTCEVTYPDPASCDASTQDAGWCSNADGGEYCALDAELYVCDAGSWVTVSDAAKDQYCQDYDFIYYYGCEGTFDTLQVYCE